MTRKGRRLTIVLTGLLLLSGATALVLIAFQDSILYFYAPSDIHAEPPAPGQAIRLGGLVEDGSVEKDDDSVTVRFRVTDLSHSTPVVYKGILPDLFREGQGVVTHGVFGPDGVFTADEVLAKHDETYMPAEVADALKKSGQWREPGAQAESN